MGVMKIQDYKPVIKIYDTTLRDGAQFEGVSLSLDDKIKIAKKLDYLGVTYIEGGWPGSNPKDMGFFQAIKREPLNHSRIAAFGSTRRPGIKARDDSNIQALLMAETNVVTLVGKSWDFHVEKALDTTLRENLNMVRESVSYLRDKGLEVIFDAEHFFDGFKHNEEYALQVLEAAADGGADWIILCDTNGGAPPWEVESIIKTVTGRIKIPLGIHTHNDSNCAVSNSLIAVRLGCLQVQGTINGYGERCGNADLCSIIPNLELKMGYKALPEGNLRRLTEVSHYVSEVANLSHHNHQPFVGHGAFAHKGGIHVSALLKNTRTYEHIDPEQVGNKRRVLVSELAGLSNLDFKAREFNIDMADGEIKRKVINEIKALENCGYQFEGADASLELYMRKALGEYQEYFSLDHFKIILEKNEKYDTLAEAVIKLNIADRVLHTAAEGEGPVNALDNTLRKALLAVYPELASMRLTDYKVRVLDGNTGTAAKVRVLIDSANENEKWTTIGVSENIIEASWQALADSINFLLLKRSFKL